MYPLTVSEPLPDTVRLHLAMIVAFWLLLNPSSTASVLPSEVAESLTASESSADPLASAEDVSVVLVLSSLDVLSSALAFASSIAALASS